VQVHFCVTPYAPDSRSPVSHNLIRVAALFIEVPKPLVDVSVRFTPSLCMSFLDWHKCQVQGRLQGPNFLWATGPSTVSQRLWPGFSPLAPLTVPPFSTSLKERGRRHIGLGEGIVVFTTILSTLASLVLLCLSGGNIPQSRNFLTESVYGDPRKKFS
jgi:hypothetical protein